MYHFLPGKTCQVSWHAVWLLQPRDGDVYLHTAEEPPRADPWPDNQSSWRWGVFPHCRQETTQATREGVSNPWRDVMAQLWVSSLVPIFSQNFCRMWCLHFVSSDDKNWGNAAFITNLSSLMGPIVTLYRHSNGLFLILLI